MITILDVPYRRFEGRLFRAERKENTLVIEFHPKQGNVDKQVLTIPVKYLFELNELVSTMYTSLKIDNGN